jgi:hypothetical protein
MTLNNLPYKMAVPGTFVKKKKPFAGTWQATGLLDHHQISAA